MSENRGKCLGAHSASPKKDTASERATGAKTKKNKKANRTGRTKKKKKKKETNGQAAKSPIKSPLCEKNVKAPPLPRGGNFARVSPVPRSRHVEPHPHSHPSPLSLERYTAFCFPRVPRNTAFTKTGARAAQEIPKTEKKRRTEGENGQIPPLPEKNQKNKKNKKIPKKQKKIPSKKEKRKWS